MRRFIAVYLAMAFSYAQQDMSHDHHRMHQMRMQQMMQECQQRMMSMMMEDPAFMERNLRMLIEHKDTVKKVLDKNLELKKELEEVIR
ncbi:hypothetical protein Thal_1556 [Thermocrinis albus DSM 14484]|uniref:Uncharacterized protein n=1 Tax=Thermocrinis albus (strain DSM 14484 / JCM 11386 / HI 11/12) TaxID=638303 RepID=D3SN55_THEAH|nr:hypothetical protein [Thermocrinis albus]ADC90185.1 hypothetical protein Thal_1556 [Thermocrinis albus DSM 14484]